VRRNHSTQYISYRTSPGFDCERSSRRNTSYADVVPGEWTKLKIEVHGDKARFVRAGLAATALVVTDPNKTQGRLPYGLEPKRSRTSPIYRITLDFENQLCD